MLGENEKMKKMTNIDVEGVNQIKKTVFSITEARREFEALCQRTSTGEVFTITRYGKPFALMVPPEKLNQ